MGARPVPAGSPRVATTDQAPARDDPFRGPPRPKPLTVPVTLKLLSNFTVTMLPSAFLTWAS